MRLFSRLVALACAAVSIVLLSSFAARAACTIYDGRNYQGEARVIERGQSVKYLGQEWDDRVSSVKVTPSCRLVTYENSTYVGDQRTFRQDTPWVERYWNNQISSARCLCGMPTHERACVLYDRADYSGVHDHVDQDERADRLANVSSLASSLTVPQGCELRASDREAGAGDQRVFASGTHRLTNTSWNNRIASAQCACTSAEPDKCQLFTGVGRSGREITISKDRQRSRMPAGFDDNTSSVGVPEGCMLRVFAGSQLSGSQRDFAAGRHDFLSSDWDNRISSAQCLCEAAEAARRPAVSCSLFTGTNRTGTRLGLEAGDERSLAGTDLGERFASAQLREGCSLTVADARGDTYTMRSSRNEVREGWQQAAVSASCSCEAERTDAGETPDDEGLGAYEGRASDGDEDARARRADGAARCELFAGRAFSGRSLPIESGTAYRFVGGLIDDRTSSFRVPEGCRLDVYENRNFNRDDVGFKGVYRSDMRRLSVRLDNRISSAACYCGAERAELDAARDGQGDDAREDARRAQARTDEDERPEDVARAGSDGARLCRMYADSDLRGGELTLKEQSGYSSLGSSWSDRVSSADVPDGCELVLYNQRGYGGGDGLKLGSGPHGDLGRRWDDAARSAKCLCTRKQARAPGFHLTRAGEAEEASGGQCELWTGANYKGYRMALGAGKQFDRLSGRFDDKISSFRLPEGCRLRVGWREGFQGGTATFRADRPRLIANYDNEVSSAACDCQ